MTTRGTLYIVGTPIGNLGDMTHRALEVLRAVPCIAAEDTRHTRKLLAHFDIHAELVRYDAHTHDRAAPRLLARLAKGESVAQVTDAGMPGISDPGVALVNAARDAGYAVEIIPGPDAVSTALVASGLPTVPYTFHGFPPRKAGARARLLAGLLAGTHVFYEAPARVAGLLASIADVQPDAPLAVCRELTKKFERVARGTAATVLAETEGGERGEVVVVLHVSASPAAAVDDATLQAALAQRLSEGAEKKAAIQAVAKAYSVPKRRVYALTLGDDG